MPVNQEKIIFKAQSMGEKCKGFSQQCKVLAREKSFSKCTSWYCKFFLPETCEDTVKSVMTPKVTLAGTQSTSIQKETQEIATIKIDGK